MKIYYAHSIRWSHTEGEREPSDIIPLLQSRWHEVLSEEIYTSSVKLTDLEIYQRDIRMINECDLILANVTNPSLGVWYELWYGESQWKTIIWFYQWSLRDSISAMLVWNPTISVHKIYDLEELKNILIF